MRLLFELDKKDYGDCTHRFTRNSARSIIIRDGKALMIYSRKYGYYKFPGGGIEAGESPLQAMIRETREAIRVTRPGGVILFAFLSVFAIMYANYFYGNWPAGQEENFTEDNAVRHFKEQLFTGYDVAEFEQLFRDKPVDWIVTAGVDGMLEAIEKRPDFSMTEEDFRAFAKWFLSFSEKRELLGCHNHLLYICRKRR